MGAIPALATTMSSRPNSSRPACSAVEEVHDEPGCQLYSLHQKGETFVFVEQWADPEALKTHSTSPAITKMFTAAGEHLAGAPDIKMLEPVPAGDPDKGQLRR